MSTNDIRDLFLQSTLEEVDTVLSSAEEKAAPSKRFEQKMRRVFRETQKGNTARILPALPARKWIAIALVAAMLLSLVGCAWVYSEEIGEVLQMLFEKKDENVKPLIKTFFDCTYIPEGYVYDSQASSDAFDEHTETQGVWKYWKNGYSTIRFNQRIHELNIVSQPSADSEIWYETIGGIERTFWILNDDETIPNDSPAYYSGSMGCFWTDGYCDYEIRFYKYHNSDEITVDEFMKIVEGIIPVYTIPQSDSDHK